MQGWNANEGWRNLLSAQQYQGQMVNKGISGLMEGLEARRERLKEEERRRRMSEGMTIAQTLPNGDVEIDQFNIFKRQNADDPEMLKAVQSERKIALGAQQTQIEKDIDAYVAGIFEKPNMRDRSALIRQGMQFWKNDPYYQESIERARKAFNLKNNRAAGGGNAQIEEFEKFLELQRIKEENPGDPIAEKNWIAFGVANNFLSENMREASTQIEKDLKEYTTGAQEYRTMASDAGDLAKRLETAEYKGGVWGKIGRRYRELLGNADYQNELSEKARNIINSDAIQHLPPGVASDRDIQLIMEGYPSDISNKEQIYSYLKTVEKVSRLAAEYRDFVADHLSENRSWENLNRRWREKKQAELDEKNKVTASESQNTTMGNQSASPTPSTPDENRMDLMRQRYGGQ